MVKKEKTWDEAITNVLENAKEPLHYAKITEEIINQCLRSKFGATPKYTVNATISASIKEKGEQSPYLRVIDPDTNKPVPGIFTLSSSRSNRNPKTVRKEVVEDTEDNGRLINSFGIFWDRNQVDWSKINPKILGVDQEGADPIDFSSQIGVYILYDGHSPIYVGRIIDRPLGKRFYEHTIDRLRGRWNKFSWFGIKSASEDGKLTDVALPSDRKVVISALEALIIEVVEPTHNRKSGDKFREVEYLQAEDPSLQEKKNEQAITALLANRTK